MKTLRLILLGAVVSVSVPATTAQAQVYSPRRLTRRIAPQLGQTNSTAHAATAAPTTPPPAPAPSTTARPSSQVRIVQPAPADPEKARAAKEDALRRTIEFQKKRAEEGSESAQYELGLRYLKGDGLEKDEATARKWLTQSAKNGYGPATRKLEELDHPAPPPATDKPAK
ncbi:MAG: hypothetical protein U1G07_21705 [Verrucomicrobiota bacterium]